MNTRVVLEPLGCPNCGRPLNAMANGGTIWLRCESDPPRCGLIYPADTALAMHIGKRTEERKPLAVVKSERQAVSE